MLSNSKIQIIKEDISTIVEPGHIRRGTYAIPHPVFDAKILHDNLFIPEFARPKDIKLSRSIMVLNSSSPTIGTKHLKPTGNRLLLDGE
ncbi:MAG: hypothetical protein MZU84_05740 [Sphingobacterium sp.]|nr:hypothetical protein [Sphingobacterium sp.]